MSPSVRSTVNAALTRGPLLAALERFVINRAHGQTNSRADGYLHPSSLCGCPTAAAHVYLGFAEVGMMTVDPKVQRIFSMGHAIHHMVQSDLIAAKLIPTVNGKPLIEVEFVDEVKKVRGSGDAIIEIDGKRFLVEIKSMNSNKFATLTAAEEHHKLQAAAYVMFLQDHLKGSTSAIILYYSKNDSEIKEFSYTVTPADLQRLEDRIQIIWALIKEYKTHGTFPAPHYSDPSKTPCRYCDWKSHCHESLFRSDWIERLKAAAKPAPGPAPVTVVAPRRAPVKPPAAVVRKLPPVR